MKILHRGGSRGRVQGVRNPPPPHPPRDDLRFSNTNGILQKKKLCGLLVLKYSKRRVHPLLKKILDPPLLQMFETGEKENPVTRTGKHAIGVTNGPKRGL